MRIHVKTSTDLMQHNFEDLYLKNFKVCWKVEYTVFFIAHLAVWNIKTKLQCHCKRQLLVNQWSGSQIKICPVFLQSQQYTLTVCCSVGLISRCAIQESVSNRCTQNWRRQMPRLTNLHSIIQIPEWCHIGRCCQGIWGLQVKSNFSKT